MNNRQENEFEKKISEIIKKDVDVPKYVDKSIKEAIKRIEKENN